jgi:hypothetical protein
MVFDLASPGGREILMLPTVATRRAQTREERSRMGTGCERVPFEGVEHRTASLSRL